MLINKNNIRFLWAVIKFIYKPFVETYMVWKTKLQALRESNRIYCIDIAFIENGPVVIESIQF